MFLKVQHEFEREISVPVVMGLALRISDILRESSITPDGITAVVRKPADDQPVVAYIMYDEVLREGFVKIFLEKMLPPEGETLGLAMLVDGEAFGFVFRLQPTPDTGLGVIEVVDVGATVPLTDEIKARLIEALQEEWAGVPKWRAIQA